MLHCFMADPFTISFLMKMITDRVDMMLTRGLTLERVTASQGRVLAYLMSRDGENVSPEGHRAAFGGLPIPRPRELSRGWNRRAG